MITIFKELLFLKPYIFVGIDVAKHHHDAFILNHSTGEIIYEHLHFDNTQKGLYSLIEAVLELESSSLLFGMEATWSLSSSSCPFPLFFRLQCWSA